MPDNNDPSIKHLIIDSIMGILACLGLVVATNSLFAGAWYLTALGIVSATVFGAWLIHRVLGHLKITEDPDMEAQPS